MNFTLEDLAVTSPAYNHFVDRIEELETMEQRLKARKLHTDFANYVQDGHGFWNWIYFVILIVVSTVQQHFGLRGVRLTKLTFGKMKLCDNRSKKCDFSLPSR